MGLLGDSGDGQKPLARKYFNLLKKQGVPVEDRRSGVESVRLSGSGEWIIVEAEDCSGLINAESKAGEVFWAFCQTLHGKELSGLEIYETKGKLGFDIQPDHTCQGYWSYSASEDKLEFGTKKAGGSSGLTNLSIEAMTPKSVNTTGNTGKSNGAGTLGSPLDSMSVGGDERQSRGRSKAVQTPSKVTDG